MEDRFISEIVRRGWHLELDIAGLCDVDSPPLRAVSEELKRFLLSFSALTNAKETTWLNSATDFISKPSESGFSWNEFELISLAGAGNDDALVQEVKSFWSGHVPVLMSVDGGYGYVAYCTSGKNRGRYVKGCEPEFEQVEVVASSLDDFKSWLLSNAV